MIGEGLYVGKVMHRRLRPKAHRLEYSVFTLLADVDRLPEIGQKLRLFSHNRRNIFSMHEKDHGRGDDLKAHLKSVARQALGNDDAQRFLILCYPRILGYVFNPLTVYYGLDARNRTVVTIYEVSNTFGERHTYALPARESDDHVIRQECDKVFHVSPFNKVNGSYLFRTRLPAADANVAILLKDDAGPLLSASFTGQHRPLSDRNLAGLFLKHGLMTAKVWLAIRYEALLLWGKRLTVYRKPEPPSQPVSTGRRETTDLAA